MTKKAALLQWRFGDFPLAVMRISRQITANFHYHEFMELVVIESGRGIHFTENESYPIASGDVFVIRKHNAHGYSNTENLRLINVLFYPGPLRLPLKELEDLPGYHALFETRRPAKIFYGFKPHLHLNLKQLAYIQNLTGFLERELQERKAGFAFTAKALLMLIAASLARYYEDRRANFQPPLAKISEAIAYMEQNYAKPICPADLPATVHMSARNFHRHFNAATGLSPVKYLIRLRVMRGAELLRQGEMNVTEAALQTGFNDSNYFSRQFRKVMGIGPRQFITCRGIAEK
ncbi:MAG: helix-turn-helix domain-containing protein [Kiritimatiellae bacterium]|nr:helix-turn-helix domain-containing protein [Kiritimatiellia bacterium]